VGEVHTCQYFKFGVRRTAAYRWDLNKTVRIIVFQIGEIGDRVCFGAKRSDPVYIEEGLELNDYDIRCVFGGDIVFEIDLLQDILYRVGSVFLGLVDSGVENAECEAVGEAVVLVCFVDVRERSAKEPR